MLKKTLFLAAVAAVSISGAALANGGGDNMVPMPAATPMTDFNPGFYIGIQGGYADSAWDNIKENSSYTDIDGNRITLNIDVSGQTGVGGRVFVGYDFLKNFAVEAGYTLFGNKASIKGVNGVELAKIKTQAFDLVGKMKVPLDNGFGIYAKAGLGYLMSSGLRDSQSGHLFADDTANHLGLVYGLGANYDVTPNFIIDLSWTRFNGDPRLNINVDKGIEDYQPNADLYAIGLAYKFDL